MANACCASRSTCSPTRRPGSSTHARWSSSVPPCGVATTEPRPASSCAGALGLVERGNGELAATGARPRKLVVTGLESLTASERRVAELAAQDLSNKEIAQALFVTVKTVEVHLSSVYRKLELSSRRQLGAALGAAAEDEPAAAAAG
jgi:DNA-binding CsgD family transcriptional regulator